MLTFDVPPQGKDPNVYLYKYHLSWEFFLGCYSAPRYIHLSDFGGMNTNPTECKEKCFKMMSSTYLPCSYIATKCVGVYFKSLTHPRKKSIT